ncbi:MAG TPA: AgmX/PglI C-terminal domain-containing protein [Kofleriaceae bacterium]|nr:AgmX/PglI C-terminal domain-containing protein [Kofleriaceae bacterium]
MTRTGWWIASALVLAAVGCSKEGAPAADQTSKGGEPAALRVEVGDCAGKDVAFVSGPRPVAPGGDPGGDPGGAFASLTGTGDISSGLDDADVYGGLLGNEVGEMQGGAGFGTIGHGSGTGSGYGSGGGMRGRSASVPTVAIGAASATGDLDKNIIRRYIRRKLPQIRYCYEKQLVAKPTLSGRVDSQFVIDPNGNVTSATATGMDPEVSACIGAAIKSIQFPKPKAGGVVKVNYPFIFRPAGSAPSEPAEPQPPAGAPEKGSKEEPRAVGQYQMKSNQVDPQLARKQAIEQARSAGILGAIDRAGGDSPPPAAPYRPGATSPLRGHEPMLATCFRKQPAAHGVAVVELDIDGAGAVTASTVHGVGGEAPACIAAAVKQLKVPGAAAGVQRCPVAFGTMPAGVVHGVDITATAVMVDGKRVADTASIAADAGPSYKIEPLYQLVRAEVEEAASGSGPVVAVRGPIVLRAIDQAPMKVVTRAFITLAMADSDYLLAAQQGSGWRLLRAVDLPVVPVAVGTGGSWNPAHRRFGRAAAIIAEPPPVASMLISRDKVWLGASRSAAEPVTIPAGPDQAAKLDEALRALKQSPAFASRRAIEIAAEDDAEYSQLVAAIDAASRAGFADWTVEAALSLSAVPPR